MEAKLIPLDGGLPIEITKDLTLVGRKEGLCDLILDRASVSKLHCLVVRTDGLLFIRDLGSTNGTKVNGQRVTRGALLPGDELAFASVKFRVYLGPGRKSTELNALRENEVTEAISLPYAEIVSDSIHDSDSDADADPDSDGDVVQFQSLVDSGVLQLDEQHDGEGMDEVGPGWDRLPEDSSPADGFDAVQSAASAEPLGADDSESDVRLLRDSDV
jgi:predicted component of type VI protein secretion system